jgi:hypothetical protein
MKQDPTGTNHPQSSQLEKFDRLLYLQKQFYNHCNFTTHFFSLILPGSDTVFAKALVGAASEAPSSAVLSQKVICCPSSKMISHINPTRPTSCTMRDLNGSISIRPQSNGVEDCRWQRERPEPILS